MVGTPRISTDKTYGSQVLDKTIERLNSTVDQRRRYEYILWLAKKFPQMPNELLAKAIKVKGCVSEVYVLGELVDGKIKWQGFSDALITKGLLALLIQGLNDLSPEEVIAIDPEFIEATGLQASLTPSRANGFLNILLNMQAQARELAISKTEET